MLIITDYLSTWGCFCTSHDPFYAIPQRSFPGPFKQTFFSGLSISHLF